MSIHEGSEITTRHNALQYVVELFCSRAGLFTRRYDHTHRNNDGNEQNGRMIDTYVELLYESFDIDYVISHPTAKSFVAGSARNQSIQHH